MVNRKLLPLHVFCVCVKQVCREDVDRYTVGIVLIPCQVKVWWVGVGDGGKAPMPLLHEMKLIGAKEEFDFLTVTSPTLCIGM